MLKRTADTNTTVATLAFTLNKDQDRTVYAIGGASGSAVTALVTPDSNPVVSASVTQVRVVNLSPTASSLDVFVTAANADLALATPTLAALDYQGARYFSVAPGTYQVRMVPAGTAAASRAANVRIAIATLALTGGTVRTIVAADNNVGGAPLRAFVLNDR